MCSAVTCRKCGKTTWAGCGQHVDQVMRNVPKAQRCEGHVKEPRSGSFLSRLFGRYAARSEKQEKRTPPHASDRRGGVRLQSSMTRIQTEQ